MTRRWQSRAVDNRECRIAPPNSLRACRPPRQRRRYKAPPGPSRTPDSGLQRARPRRHHRRRFATASRHSGSIFICSRSSPCRSARCAITRRCRGSTPVTAKSSPRGFSALCRSGFAVAEARQPFGLALRAGGAAAVAQEPRHRPVLQSFRCDADRFGLSPIARIPRRQSRDRAFSGVRVHPGRGSRHGTDRA